MGQVATNLHDRLATLVIGMGYAFWGCEWHRDGRQAALRLYIDKTGGVTLTDCTNVSRQISAVLDVEELVSGHYTLEVSSPGVARPLFNLSQYQHYLGKEVMLRLFEVHEGRRQLKGVLLAANSSEVSLKLPEGEINIPFSVIKRANLVADLFKNKGSASARTKRKKQEEQI